MTRLVWDELWLAQAGVDRGVLYPSVGPGVAWNGLISVKELPASEERIRHLDGIKIGSRRTRDDFLGTIEAFTYPDELYDNTVVQDRSNAFGLSYRVLAGEYYRIHLVYNVLIGPSVRNFDQSEFDRLVWDFTTLPVTVPGRTRSAHLIIDNSAAYSWVVTDIEEILYGTGTQDPRLPLPEELYDIVEAGSILLVVDNGDGTFSVTGPDDVIIMLTSTTFEITWPSVINLDADTYQISSL